MFVITMRAPEDEEIWVSECSELEDALAELSEYLEVDSLELDEATNTYPYGEWAITFREVFTLMRVC